MNKMRIPGFTALDSLCPSKVRYRAAGALYQKQPNRLVPQLPIHIGKACGGCVGGSRLDWLFGTTGFRECADFSCDPSEGKCEYGEIQIEDC